jgi:hypothetical protein
MLDGRWFQESADDRNDEFGSRGIQYLRRILESYEGYK